MAGRTYGDLDPALSWSCGYMEHETDPACMVPAKWHGIIVDIWKSVSCCDKHVDVMRLSADYVHEMETACHLPGSMFDFDENRCFMPEEQGIDHWSGETPSLSVRG